MVESGSKRIATACGPKQLKIVSSRNSLTPSVFKITKTPGPGHYSELQQFNAQGQYSLSKHARPAGYAFKTDNWQAPKKTDRVSVADIRKPGPGYYETS